MEGVLNQPLNQLKLWNIKPIPTVVEIYISKWNIILDITVQIRPFAYLLYCITLLWVMWQKTWFKSAKLTFIVLLRWSHWAMHAQCIPGFCWAISVLRKPTFQNCKAHNIQLLCWETKSAQWFPKAILCPCRNKIKLMRVNATKSLNDPSKWNITNLLTSVLQSLKWEQIDEKSIVPMNSSGAESGTGRTVSGTASVVLNK